MQRRKGCKRKQQSQRFSTRKESMRKISKQCRSTAFCETHSLMLYTQMKHTLHVHKATDYLHRPNWRHSRRRRRTSSARRRRSRPIVSASQPNSTKNELPGKRRGWLRERLEQPRVRPQGRKRTRCEHQKTHNSTRFMNSMRPRGLRRVGSPPACREWKARLRISRSA